MIVHFENVGARKESWSAVVESASGSSLEREIRKRGALMSRCVDFLLNEDGMSGTVIVGGARAVGKFRIEGGMILSVELCAS